ncbi:MAG: peptidoglycan-binding domain-containing protein [Acutalibacteraceae bacterium]
MNKKIMALCCALVAFSVVFTVSFGGAKNNRADTTVVNKNEYKADVTDIIGSVTDKADGIVNGVEDAVTGNIGNSIGGVVEKVTDAFGNIINGGGQGGSILDGIGSGSILGGLGDLIGSIGGNNSGGNLATEGTTANISSITPVPAATQYVTVIVTEKVIVTVDNTAASSTDADAYDANVLYNPYTKPTKDFVAGDSDESIKWLQWIFVHTGYGLSEDGITGVLDDNTVELIKKLQTENGLEPNGNINEDVLNVAEVMYYQYSLGQNQAESTTLAPNGTEVNEEADSANSKQAVVSLISIIAIVLVWIAVVVVILIIFIKRKKGKNKKADSKDKSPEEDIKAKDETDKKDEAESKEDTEKKDGTIRSLSDLFDEVNE